MRFNVEHNRFQSSGLGQALTVLNAVLARSGDQHLDIAHRRRAGPQHAEVEADFVERERNVLVRFRLDLQFEFFFPQPSGQHDLLGDDGRLRHRQHHLTGLGAAFRDNALDSVCDLVEFLDLPVCDPALFETLGAKPLEHVLARCRLTQLDQFDAGRADVQPNHRSKFAPQKSV